MSAYCGNVGKGCKEIKPGKMIEEVCSFCGNWNPNYECQINDEIFYRKEDANQPTGKYEPVETRDQIFPEPELTCHLCGIIVNDGVILGITEDKKAVEFCCFDCASELGIPVAIQMVN